jgi:quinolinate synthase
LPADKQVLFVPDQHLGRFVQERTGRDLVLWPGYCTTHVRIAEEDIKAARQAYPEAVVLAHPECSEPVKDLADELLSTGQMFKYARTSSARQFIIATEIGMIHALKKARPDADFITASARGICPNMKKTTLDKLLASLENRQYEITVPSDIAVAARRSLDRMVEILPKD